MSQVEKLVFPASKTGYKKSEQRGNTVLINFMYVYGMNNSIFDDDKLGYDCTHLNLFEVENASINIAKDNKTATIVQRHKHVEDDEGALARVFQAHILNTTFVGAYENRFAFTGSLSEVFYYNDITDLTNAEQPSFVPPKQKNPGGIDFLPVEFITLRR